MDVATDGFLHADTTGRIISAAITVHSALGPGLLESAYRECLAHRLRADGRDAKQEFPIPLRFQELVIHACYRADLVVDNTVLGELKAVESIQSLHESQILTYLKLSGIRVGLLINFNVRRLRSGIHRFVR